MKPQDNRDTSVKKVASEILGNQNLVDILFPLSFLLVLTIIVDTLNPNFLTFTNIRNVVNHSAYFIILGIGMTFVITGGGIDLSIGSIVALVSVIVAQFILESGSELPMLLRDLTECDGEDIQHLLPDVTGQIPSMFATVLDEGIAAGEIRPVDAQRVGFLLLGVINSLAARRMHENVVEPLAEDIDLAVSILFEGIGTK